MPASEEISRRSCVLVLLAALVAAQSGVFFSGRTLLPIAPSVTTTAGVPFGYTGPQSHGTNAIDPAGSLNASYVFDLYTLAALKEGTLPFWNPYQGLGQPMLGNGLSAVLYPLNVLLLLVPRSWWDIVYLVNWLLAAYFVTEYLRLIGCRREGIVLGGVTVIGSGFFQYYLAMREVVAVAAWFPLLLYALERTAREPEWRHRHLVLALAVACCLTAGQPESSFIALAFAAGYGLVTMAALGRRGWRFAVDCAPGAGAGLLLSAPFWLTFADYAFKAFSNHPAGSPMSTIALDWRTAASYLFPQLFGRIQTVPFATPVPGWVWDYSPGWMTVAAGLLAFAGLGAAVRERRRELLLNAAMGLLILAKTWAIPGATVLAVLPLFDRVVYPRYASFVAAICAAVLAGVGFDRLYAMDRRRAARVIACWVVVLAALYAIARVWTLPIFASREVRLYSALGLAWALAVPLGLLWIKYRRRETYLAVASGAAIVLQLAAYVPGYTPADYLGIAAATLGAWCVGAAAIGSGRVRVTPTAAAGVALCAIALIGAAAPRFAAAGLPRRYDVMTAPPYIQELRRLQRLGERVYALDGNPQPNFGAAFRVASLNTLDVLAPAESAAFINTYLDRSADPLWFSGTTGGRRDGPGTPLSELSDNQRYFDFVGVRYLTSSRSTPAHAAYDTTVDRSSSPSPKPLVSPLESWFVAPFESCDLIEVLFSTYGQRNPGTVRLTLLDADRRPIGESTLPGELVRDNSYAVFAFSNVRPRIGQRVGVRVSFEPAAIGPMVAVWEYPPDSSASFAFRIPAPTSRVRPVFTDERTGVVVWERLDALPRAFLATRARVERDPRVALGMIAGTPGLRRDVVIDSGPAIEGAGSDDVEPGELVDLQTSPNRVRIRYQARASGILTLTDSYSPGWTASVNGTPTEIHRVNGAFRGVRIAAPGEYVVEYTYRPPRWWLSCGLAAAGLVVVAAATARRTAPWARA
jgi:hypothetical protein